MRHKLIYYPHETLTKKAQPVTAFDNTLKVLLKDMRSIMNAQKGVGIAAPQVGVSLRCFLARYEERIHTFVNPTISGCVPETSEYEEGCLSIPGVYANVTRSSALHVDAYDANNKAFSLSADGFFARIIQHEYDHLEGVLFIDIISRTQRRLSLKTYKQPEDVLT